jgi:predicted N-acetyltransferase YhbS
VSGISFSLATHDDEAGIRQLLASQPMPGKIRLRFEREPDYFAGCATMGPFTQVLVAREEDRVVGVACRAIRKLYVNGVAEDVGYLGQLRVDAAHRGRMLVARGFARLRELHADGRAKGYVTTIVDGNDEAEGVLVRRARRAMPRYRHLDRLVTLAIPAGQKPASGGSRQPSPRSVADILATLGPARNLFPADMPEGAVVAVEGGVAALDDQRAYKQTVVDGYDVMTGMLRPFYNLVAKIRLPRPGSRLEHAFVTHFCAATADAANELIGLLRSEAASRGLDHILFGFTSSDPLLEVARRFKPVEYHSSIYTVSFGDQADSDDLHDRLDERPLALDIAAL